MRIIAIAVLLASLPLFSQTNNVPTHSDEIVSESVLLERIPQLLVKRDDLVKQGWDTPGKITDKYIHFVRTNYSFAGITGTVSFGYEQQLLEGFSFFINNTNADFARLEKYLCKTLNSNGKHDKGWADDTTIAVRWEVTGKSTNYEILLTQMKFGNEVERAFHIMLHPVNRR